MVEPENERISPRRLVAEVTSRLERAEQALRFGAGERARVEAGMRACEEALELLRDAETAGGGDRSAEEGDTGAGRLMRARLEAAVWSRRGHLCDATARAAGSDAGAWAWMEALRAHDRALELLCRGGVAETDAALLAGIWIDRGNALQRLGTEASSKEAERSRDQARGLLEQAEARVDAAAGARVDAHALAAVRLNLGLARRAAGAAAGALEEFREVVAALAGWEATEAEAAEIGLRARHAACVTLGEQLAEEGYAVTDTTRERLAEAAKLVEDGLAVARGWAGRGGGAERASGARMFEFGAWLYRTYGQGQLAPYLAAHLEPADAARVEIARVALEAARAEILQQGFGRLIGEDAERVAAELAGLREVEERLHGLAAGLAAEEARQEATS